MNRIIKLAENKPRNCKISNSGEINYSKLAIVEI